MIIQKTFFALCCDNCKKILSGFDDESTGYWTDESSAYDVSAESYEEVKGKVICTDCYEYDDEDEMVVIASRENMFLNKLNL